MSATSSQRRRSITLAQPITATKLEDVLTHVNSQIPNAGLRYTITASVAFHMGVKYTNSSYNIVLHIEGGRHALETSLIVADNPITQLHIVDDRESRVRISADHASYDRLSEMIDSYLRAL